MCALGLGWRRVVEIVLGTPPPSPSSSPLDLGRQVCAVIVVRASVCRERRARALVQTLCDPLLAAGRVPGWWEAP